MSARLRQFLAEYGAGDGVFYLGHAGILVVLGGKKILFDPIVESQPYGDSWVFFPPQVDDRLLYDVDAVVVSHIHQDHYDLGFVQRLAPHVQVAIIGQRPAFEADIGARAGRPVTIVAPDTVHALFDGVHLYGVAHESNGVDASTIVYNERFCVYHGNDNYLHPASMAKFARIAPRIDVACIPYAYIHWYPFLMEYPAGQLQEKAAEAERLVNHYMDDCLNAIAILRPQLVIPFGANLLIDDGDMHSEINLAVRTPVEFADYARARLGPAGDVVQAMLAGDFAGRRDGVLTADIAARYDAAQYRAAADRFLQARPQKQARGDAALLAVPDFVALLNERLQAQHGAIDNLLQFELALPDQPPLRIEIDGLTWQARHVAAFTTGRARHRFKLDAVSSTEWLSGKRFEEIIGMRRFTLLREPNLYLPDMLKVVNTVV